MHGKSCFNFRELDPERLRDVAALKRKGYDRLVEENVV